MQSNSIPSNLAQNANEQSEHNEQPNLASNSPLSSEAEEVLSAVLTLLCQDANDYTVPHFLKDNAKFQQIFNIQKETQLFCNALREGRLEHKTSVKSYTISQLKAMQVELRNLVWQMKEVTTDNSQVSSVITGEISESFNSMLKRFNHTIQEIRQLSKNYEEISSHDPLTGCYNRNALKKEFLESIAKSHEDGHSCGLFMLDLDHFKAINDTYGHTTGDIVLKQFVQKIYDTIRGTDLCCRLGGEEFAILIPVATAEALWKIDERLRKNIQTIQVKRHDSAISITHSAGITLFPSQVIDEAGLSKLISFTDKLLYKAKANGRNCSFFAEYEAE